MPKLKLKFKDNRKEGRKAPPPARAPDWDHTKVRTPEPTRRLPKFEVKRDFVAIIEYRKEARDFATIQKLGFKAEGGFKDACAEAERMADLLGKCLAIDLFEMRKVKICRVLAVYESNAFSDWEKENVSEAKATKHVKKAVKAFKAESNNVISYVKDIRTR